MIAVYGENYKNPTIQNAELVIVKAASYHSALMGLFCDCIMSTR
jgi:hypothetical protein